MTVNIAHAPDASASAKAPQVATLEIGEPTLKNLVKVFKVLADESRLKILLALVEDGELHVNALCDLVHQSQPAVSHHLSRLLDHGLVHRRRDGKHNYYSADAGRVRLLLTQFLADPITRPSPLAFPAFMDNFTKV